jgi:carbamoyltransferase
VVQQGDGSFWLDPNYFASHYSTKHSYSSRFEDLFGEPREPDAPFFTKDSDYPDYFGPRPRNYDELCEYNQRYADIAASVQAVTEELMLQLARALNRQTGLTKLCMAGGVALNSVANARILKETPFDEMYVQPSAGDGGGALGAALYAWNCALGNSKRMVMDHAYWGQEYDAGEVRTAIGDAGASGLYVEDNQKLVEMTVERLTAGKVVGFFQKRFEWGPRALGNRSILADPRKAETKDLVNNKIKFREPFRPFAPAVLAEASHEYFDLPEPERHMPARFMLLVVPVHEDKQGVVPAVSHMGTARIQTVQKETNPIFHQLIKSFGEATGVPVLMNTSFNVRGEPIVNSPQDALKTFANSGIDSLVMGDYLIDKE